MARVAGETCRLQGELGLSSLAVVLLCAMIPQNVFAQEASIRLHAGWAIQSSEKVTSTGEHISRPGFDAKNWYHTTVPSTVVGVLVENKVYPDPYFGMNLRSYPGMNYPIGAKFSDYDMPADSPFAKPWWYRTEFEIPARFRGKTIWLAFGGINYRANIWFNGTKIADAGETAGAFRRYEFNVTHHVHAGKRNALAVEVLAPEAGDLAITWVDWNPMPPDKNMGLWQEVVLSASGPVAVRNPYVRSKLDLPSHAAARLNVGTQLRNATGRSVRGKLCGRIEGEGAPLEFSTDVELAGHETRDLLIDPERVTALNLRKPRLWWPYRMGEPFLHTLTLDFVTADGSLSDRQTIRFGIEQTTSEFTPDGYLLFRINGRPILIRGGGWAPDMLWRSNPQRRADEFRYVKEMGLNAIRLEGKLEDDEFFELADREGILVMAGWCCCDFWEKWDKWDDAAKQVSVASLTDQILRLRRHPSVLAWLNGSDNPPPADREKAYLDALQQADWAKPVLSSATQKRADYSGPSGVKMLGPYDYVTPNYWLLDSNHGGAYGFNTETSPGPAPPPVESLRRFLPAEKLWPMNEVWGYHSGGGAFKDIRLFARALDARYGEAKNLDDFAWKSQAATYEGERAMFEAFGRNKYRSTGVIQWMLNNAWPGLIWHLYDYYLRPAGGYFGTKKALELLHIQYSYDDHSIVIVNEHAESVPQLRAVAKVYDISLRERFSREATVEATADAATRAFAIPDIADLSPTYFLRLDLYSSLGANVSHNFYWLSSQPDVLNWDKSTWYSSPNSGYADLTGLETLPRVSLKVSASFAMSGEGEEESARVIVENPDESPAFLVRLRVTRGKDGDEVLPVFWADNYFELWPGEKRVINVRFHKRDLAGARPVVAVDGWNVQPISSVGE
jgi:exo-1,4-beta-D-glucosaminidase